MTTPDCQENSVKSTGRDFLYFEPSKVCFYCQDC